MIRKAEVSFIYLCLYLGGDFFLLDSVRVWRQHTTTDEVGSPILTPILWVHLLTRLIASFPNLYVWLKKETTWLARSCLYFLCLEVLSIISVPSPTSWSISCMVPSPPFMFQVSHFIPFNPFELIFMYCESWGFLLSFWKWISAFPNSICWRLPFLECMPSPVLLKTIWRQGMGMKFF